MWVCALYFPSLSMYINIQGSLYRVCLLVRVRMWVFRYPPFFIFTSFVFRMKHEQSSPKGSGSLSLPSLHSLMMWLHSIFWFELIIILLYMLIVSPSSSLLLSIHPFHFTPCSFLTATYSQFVIFLVSLLHISLSVWFSSLPHYYYYTHIGHS